MEPGILAGVAAVAVHAARESGDEAMSAIAFPTGRKTKVPGYPLRATACGCGCRRIVHDETCCRWGRYEAHVISATWARQAQRMAMRQSVAT